MHELAITQSIMRIALKTAQENGAKRIKTIRLQLGDYSDVMPEYVEKYFDLVSCDTIACGAHIEAYRQRARIRCEACGEESEVERGEARCPKCGAETIKMLSGTQCLVESIEVE